MEKYFFTWGIIKKIFNFNTKIIKNYFKPHHFTKYEDIIMNKIFYWIFFLRYEVFFLEQEKEVILSYY